MGGEGRGRRVRREKVRGRVWGGKAEQGEKEEEGKDQGEGEEGKEEGEGEGKQGKGAKEGK